MKALEWLLPKILFTAKVKMLFTKFPHIFTGKNYVIKFETKKQISKFCYLLTQIKYRRYKNVKTLLNRQTKKQINKKT